MGATTLSIAITNFLCNKIRKKAAYLELNGTHAISALADQSGSNSFYYYGMNLFPNGTFLQLPEILSQSYDYFVLDLGVLNPNNYREFLQNDLGLVVGSVCPWKSAQYGAFLQKYFHNKTDRPETIRYLGTFGIKEDLKQFAHRYGFPVTSFPYLENPFQLSSVNWHFIETLLTDIGT